MSRSRCVVGIAIGAERIVARIRGDDTTLFFERPAGGRWEMQDLRSAFEAVIAALPNHARAELHIVLMPPLARVRRLELPPLHSGDLQTILARNSRQYFPTPEAVVTGFPVTRGTRVDANPWVSAASEALLHSIHDAASQLDVRIARVSDAFGALIACARQAVPRTNGLLAVIRHESETIVLTSRDGRMDHLRRFPTRAGPAASLLEDAAMETDSGTAWVAIGGALDDLPRPFAAVVEGDPDILAAAHAADANGIDLVPERVRHVRMQRVRRRSVRMMVAAVIILVVASLIETAGLTMRVNAVRAQRAELGALVGPVLAMRDSLADVRARLEDLQRIDSAAVRWTDVLFELAMLLPDDAHLTQLAGDADSVVVRGTAIHAARAVESLGNGTTVQEPRFMGAIRRELREDQEPLEHFVVAASLRKRPATR